MLCLPIWPKILSGQKGIYLDDSRGTTWKFYFFSPLPGFAVLTSPAPYKTALPPPQPCVIRIA